MALTSIYAKLVAAFLFILALSLAIYIALFSITMEREAERTLARSIPVISSLLNAEFACPVLKNKPASPENKEKLTRVLKRLQETLQAEHVWVISPEDSIILPEGATLHPDHELEYASMFNDGISAAFISQTKTNKQAVVFPISLWEERAKLILVRDSFWPYHHFLLDFCIPIAVAGLITCLLLLPMMRNLLRPLKELETRVIDFATGDLSQRAKPLHNDEVGRLARAFNILADNIEQMTRVRHELTANISHELRSPLTRIQMSEELARMNCEQQDVEKITKHLMSIRTEVEELDGLIDEILKLSKLELTAELGATGACDITDTIIKLIKKNAPIIERKALNIQQSYSHDCVITCNYPMVTLAISNLLSNALKFTEPEGTINICTMSTANAVSINVSNSFYRKLSDQELIDIFEPFSRAEGENIPGTGIGLALVAKVAEQHSGSVFAENRSNGVLFRLTLPRNLAEVEKKQAC